jgi:predicted dithiol-disulfide oxidoreductase (DUF899 family)
MSDLKSQIQELEKSMYQTAVQLEKLRREIKPVEVKNYAFVTSTGKTSLLELFGSKEKLLAIHNMGQGCRWCTAWGDALNGVLTHLESQFSVVVVSKDPPEIQRKFASERQWKFLMASHGGGEYITDQTVRPGQGNMPGVVAYERQGSKIFRKNSSEFGPGDAFNPLFHYGTLLGMGFEEYPLEYSYWSRPQKLDDGG